MTFFNSIMTCYKKSFDFKGRASKSEYWWFVLYLGLLFGLSIWLNDIDSEIVGGVYVGLIIGTVPAMFSVLVRRFHDVGLSTWSCIKRLLQIVGLSFWGVYITCNIREFYTYCINSFVVAIYRIFVYVYSIDRG